MSKKIGPREVPARDDFYMALAFWNASKSKDPHTQVGAIIIGSDNAPISSGYNGPPKQYNDNQINWDRPDKYDFIMHAEHNAIKYAKNENLSGATIYVTGIPCKDCLLEIVEAGIKKIVYFPFKSKDLDSMFSKPTDLARLEEIVKPAYANLIEFKGNLNWMRDRMKNLESLGVFN